MLYKPVECQKSRSSDNEFLSRVHESFDTGARVKLGFVTNCVDTFAPPMPAYQRGDCDYCGQRLIAVFRSILDALNILRGRVSQHPCRKVTGRQYDDYQQHEQSECRADADARQYRGIYVIDPCIDSAAPNAKVASKNFANESLHQRHCTG